LTALPGWTITRSLHHRSRKWHERIALSTDCAAQLMDNKSG